MSKPAELIAATIAARVGTEVRISAIRPRIAGEQGHSGAALRYYDVTFMAFGGQRQITLVTKEAARSERQLLTWLSAQRLPVPDSHTCDLTTAAPTPICMEYLSDSAPGDNRVHAVARALAAIHHAASNRREELPWLPCADQAFFADRLIDRCWRKPWQRLLTGGGYTDWYGRWQPAIPPDAEFAATFAVVTPALEEVAAQFVRDMTALLRESNTLTLVHADFHRDHVRWQGDQARIIDWGQAHYGPYAIDLPNYFSRDEALHYRDALAALGQTIPREVFLAHYDTARPYPGFKYFGSGLWQWQFGAQARRQQSVQYWIDLVLGEAGNSKR